MVRINDDCNENKQRSGERKGGSRIGKSEVQYSNVREDRWDEKALSTFQLTGLRFRSLRTGSLVDYWTSEESEREGT